MPERDPIDEAIQRVTDERVREAVARIAEQLKATTAEMLDEIARHPEQLVDAQDPKSGRMTRSDVKTLLGVSVSRLRTLERNGKISVYRDGRVWLDPREVADALGVPVPQG
jgi:hypothetical protein